MSGGGATPGENGFQAVVGSVGPVIGGYVDVGLGGGKGVWEGGVGRVRYGYG